MAFKLNEDESRFWDMVAKVVGAIVSPISSKPATFMVTRGI
jgi:hypothetical protein